MFKYFFSFNLDIRIHTSPKEDGHGSKALGPGDKGRKGEVLEALLVKNNRILKSGSLT